MTCKKDWIRRAIAFAAALIMMVNIAAAPQRAKAVAVSASVVAAVAAIMTACGVRYWAATSDYASDYLSDEIRSYLALNAVPGEGIPTYEEWLGIDATSQLWEVTGNGAMSFTGSIASKILDFVSWSFEHNNVHSNGPTVGLLAGPVPVLTTSLLQEGDGEPSFSYSSSSFRASFKDIKLYTRNVFFTAALYIPGVYGAKVTITSVNEGNCERIDDYGYVGLAIADSENAGGTRIPLEVGRSFHVASSVDRPYNYVVLSFNNPTKYTDAEDIRHSWGVTCSIEIEGGPGSLSYPDRVKVQPSTNVFVPDNVRLNQAEPYVVATNAALAQGMTADQAADAIMDAVITTGLEAEAGDDAGDDAEPEGGVLEGWGWLSQILQRIERAISGTEEQTAPAQYEAIDDYQLDLTSFFPFCLPWDIHRGLSLLVAEPVAPSINWTVPLPGGGTYTLALDLSEWDGVAQVARTMELLAFVVALAVATKKLIKW